MISVQIDGSVIIGNMMGDSQNECFRLFKNKPHQSGYANKNGIFCLTQTDCTTTAPSTTGSAHTDPVATGRVDNGARKLKLAQSSSFPEAVMRRGTTWDGMF